MQFTMLLLLAVQVFGQDGGDIDGGEGSPDGEYDGQGQGPAQPPVAILSHHQELGDDGTFKYSFSADNGLQQREAFHPDGSRTGAYSYVDPHGETVLVHYRADRFGFHVLDGSSIPTTPPQAGRPQGQHSNYEDGPDVPRESAGPEVSSYEVEEPEEGPSSSSGSPLLPATTPKSIPFGFEMSRAPNMPGIHNRFYRSAAQELFAEPLVADQSDLDSVAAEDLSGAASSHHGHRQHYGLPDPNASSFYRVQRRSAQDSDAAAVIYGKQKRSVYRLPLGSIRDTYVERDSPDLNEAASAFYGIQRHSADTVEAPIIYGKQKRLAGSPEESVRHTASADNLQLSGGEAASSQEDQDSDLKGAGSSPYGLRGYVPVDQKRTAYKSPFASLARQIQYPVKKGRAEAEVEGVPVRSNDRGRKFSSRARESNDRAREFHDSGRESSDGGREFSNRGRESSDGGREQAAATDTGDYGHHAGRHDDGSYANHAHKYDDGSYQQHAVKYDDGSYDRYANMHGEGHYGEPSEHDGEPSGHYAADEEVVPIGRGETEVSSRNTGEGLVSHY